jgi:hypothetical protein
MRPDVEESDKYCRKESKKYFKQEDWKGWRFLTFFEQILKNHKLIQKFTLKFRKPTQILTKIHFDLGLALYMNMLWMGPGRGKRGRGYRGGGGKI